MEENHTRLDPQVERFLELLHIPLDKVEVEDDKA